MDNKNQNSKNECKSKSHLKEVICDVESCAYHNGNNECCAKCICVGPCSADCSANTSCATYKPREEI